MEAQSSNADGIREAVAHLDARIDRRFEGIDQRFEGIDRRFESVDRRFEGIDCRFEAVELRLTALDQKIDGRFDTLDGKLSRQFMWLVGIQVTTLATIVAAVIAAALTR